ncbi:unnamed protein product [Gordionus sp. m RMFG-2023]|uniref:probable RNA methyltransferase Y17G7B.18 n=1 Tax=Gordionus sp. m RMFG-2023 TaxID=3053472 RepID=UPI0030E177F6
MEKFKKFKIDQQFFCGGNSEDPLNLESICPEDFNKCNYIGENQKSDTRLSILQREWVKEKKVLDIGCNTGFVTKYIAKHLNPSKIIGYDIDNNLIKKAKIDLLKDLDIKYHKKPNIIHNTSTLYLYPTYNDETKHKYPYNIDFITANYVCECQEILKIQRPEFDIIICLSVSKWIHLNWGDNGLKITFQRIYEQLNDNGIFFFEPQEWMSYKKAKKKTKLSFTHLNFKPNQFKSYLLNEVGFSYVKAFYPQKSSSIGFERTLYVFLKAEKGTITEHLVKELNLEGGEYTTA